MFITRHALARRTFLRGVGAAVALPFLDAMVPALAKAQGRKPPAWVKELREMIQDQVDAHLTLKELSKDLDINPAYLSREFSKYFDNLSFGEYLRKRRIEKALELLGATDYSLTEIAYLTGFSDQSHFTRTFRQHTGKNPSAYRKHLRKGNADTNG